MNKADYSARDVQMQRVVLIWSLSVLSICCAASPEVRAQSSASKSTSTSSQSSSANDDTKPLGFSIESEMLTYRALETNTEAIACDIGAYLNGATVNFSNPSGGTVCGVQSGATNNKVSVVIANFDHNAFDDFHLWRAHMEVIRELRARGAAYCPESTLHDFGPRGSGAGGGSNSHSATAATAAQAALSLTSVGTVLAVAQTALGLLASEATNSPVVGTIQDQALMNGVARKLRNLNV